MYPFTIKVPTSKKSKWENKCLGIIIHHTAWWVWIWANVVWIYAASNSACSFSIAEILLFKDE